MDRITTIQVSSSTRDRLYKLKFRKTYDEYLNFLMDMSEKLEREGVRGWVKRNVKWKNGRMAAVDLDGR
jgi:hypothetical protein